MIDNDVTVVVATRNRAGRLMETMPMHEGPVILVDNASDDGTPDLIEAAFPQVRVVRLEDNRGAAARNAGVELAATEFVAFADDDSYWTAGSLRKAAGLLRDFPRTGLLCAQVLVGPEQFLDPISAEMARAPLGVPDDAPGPAVLGFLSCAAVVRRSAFLQAGGFNPTLHVYGEEALLAMDMAAAGWLLSYTPELTVRHLPEPAGRDPRARRRRQARNDLLTAMLRRPPRVVARTAARAWRHDRGAVTDAARLLPWALRRRHPLPTRVERDLCTLTSR
ncbi:glycosyltransferase [Actinoplanes sp. NPDC051633]|uniref:glycosyltransferase family 2 protein n=1 Tax=Actinoplanes sp. NPDC051633 TaxID=3155670 RepID=UPI00344A03DF